MGVVRVIFLGCMIAYKVVMVLINISSWICIL
jgi:hypothetical protein